MSKKKKKIVEPVVETPVAPVAKEVKPEPKLKVKLTVSRVGTNFTQEAGQVVKVDAAEAKRMIAAQQCVPA